MPTNPIYNNLDPAWYDFRNQGEAVTFKPGFAREADAGEKINGETADAGDLVITNAGGRTFRVSDEIEKKRWKLDGESPRPIWSAASSSPAMWRPMPGHR